MARNALKQAASRSQRTTKRRYFLWNHAHVRSVWTRGASFFMGAPTRPAGLPRPCGALGPDPACAESMAQAFGLIPFPCRQDLEPFARSAACAGTDVQGLQSWTDLGPLVTCRGRCARGPGHTSAVRAVVDENALAVSAIGDALTAACARGKRSHPRRRSPTESGRVPRPVRAGGLASPPGCHHLATAVTHKARHSWTPMGSAGEITPAAAGDQHVQQGMEDLATGGMRHAPTPLRRLWRKKGCAKLPLQVAKPIACACHRALPKRWRA
jgi:hypothetical protein